MANCNQVIGDRGHCTPFQGKTLVCIFHIGLLHCCMHAHTNTHTHTHTQADWQLRRESSRPCETQAYSAQSNKPSHCSDIKQTINTNPISFNSWINGNRVDKTCKKIQKTLNYWEANLRTRGQLLITLKRLETGFFLSLASTKQTRREVNLERSKAIIRSLDSVNG